MMKHGRRINVKSRCHVGTIGQFQSMDRRNTPVMLNIKFNTHGKKSQYAGCILSNHHPAFTNARLHGGIKTHRQRYWTNQARNGRGGSCPDGHPAWMIMQQVPAAHRPDGGDPSRFAQPHLSIYCILDPLFILYIASLIRLYSSPSLQFQYSAISSLPPNQAPVYIYIYWWWQPLNAP